MESLEDSPASWKSPSPLQPYHQSHKPMRCTQESIMVWRCFQEVANKALQMSIKVVVAGPQSRRGISLYVMGHSHLTVKSYAHFWSSQITGAIVNLPSVQSKSIQIIKGLENQAYGQRWKELETCLIPWGQDFPVLPSRTLGTVSALFWEIGICRKSPSVSPGRKMTRTWKQSSDIWKW